MKEEIKVHYDNMKQIMAFLEKQERNLPKEGLPSDRKESDKTLKQIKAEKEAAAQREAET